VYWYHFWFNGEHIQESTKQRNPRVARQMESAHRTALAKGEVGIVERKPAPTLQDFAQHFIDAIQIRSAAKPRTIAFYAEQLSRLLEFEPLATARLDKIDEALIESYVQQRRKQVAPATVNRALATLRRLLRLAFEWQVINRVPRIRILPGEHNREFVLSHKLESEYLEGAPQPLRDVALLTLDTGLRISEALELEWRDVYLKPVGAARLGYIHVRIGKSKNARRNLSLTARARGMLEARSTQTDSPYVFPSETGRPYLVTSLDHLHSDVRKALRLPADFVIHSLRHSFGTRLGEAGADAFTIMRIMGHSSVTVSQKYVHPTPEAMERAFERLEALNDAARQLAATVPATVPKTLPASD
jgi:site-specific recombinase XerD